MKIQPKNAASRELRLKKWSEERSRGDVRTMGFMASQTSSQGGNKQNVSPVGRAASGSRGDSQAGASLSRQSANM